MYNKIKPTVSQYLIVQKFRAAFGYPVPSVPSTCSNDWSVYSWCKGKCKVNGSIAVCKTPHCYGNSHAEWDHTVLPATRQRWHSWPYPRRSWYSIKQPKRDARLSWPSWLVTYQDGIPARKWAWRELTSFIRQTPLTTTPRCQPWEVPMYRFCCLRLTQWPAATALNAPYQHLTAISQRTWWTCWTGSWSFMWPTVNTNSWTFSTGSPLISRINTMNEDSMHFIVWLSDLLLLLLHPFNDCFVSCFRRVLFFHLY